MENITRKQMFQIDMMINRKIASQKRELNKGVANRDLSKRATIIMQNILKSGNGNMFPNKAV